MLVVGLWGLLTWDLGPPMNLTWDPGQKLAASRVWLPTLLRKELTAGMWKGDPLEKEKQLQKKHQFPGFMIKLRGVAFEPPRCFRGKNSLLGSREATGMIWEVRFVDGHCVAYKLLMDRYLTDAHKRSTIWSKQFWPTWYWYVRITLPKQCHSSSKHVHLITISNTEPLNTPVLDWIFPKGKWWSTKCKGVWKPRVIHMYKFNSA